MYATSAQAGSYVIGDCGSAANHTATAGPWELVGEIDSPSFALKQQCPGGPGDWLGIASVEFDPLLKGFGVNTQGTPLTITHLRVWWRAVGASSGSSIAEISVRNAAGYPLPGFSVSTTDSIWDTTAGPQELEFPASDGVALVEVGERCASSCDSQSALLYEGIPVVVQMFGAELTIGDSTPPTVTLTGGLEGNAPVTGSIPIAFFAADPGAGIERAELLVDGVPIASHDYTPTCSYTQLRPCPESESDQFSLEGASLPEGSHQLTIRVTDAAGNTALSPARTVTTSRPPVPNGDPCTNPAMSISLNRSDPIPFGRATTAVGRLGCGSTPIVGATVEIQSSTTAGAQATALGSIVTGSDGTFTYPVPAGPSRKLSFSYSAYSNEAAPAAQTTIQVTVEPKLTLSIRPCHIPRKRGAGRVCGRASSGSLLVHTHNHGEIAWQGRIEGGPYPPNGIPLLAQVQEIRFERIRARGRWRRVRHEDWLTFHEIVAHAGKISYEYTFERTFHPTIYTFRVATPSGGDDAGYEYAPGASNQVSVLVG